MVKLAKKSLVFLLIIEQFSKNVPNIDTLLDIRLVIMSERDKNKDNKDYLCIINNDLKIIDNILSVLAKELK